LQQVIKRYNEEQNNFQTTIHPINKINLTYSHSSGPLIDENDFHGFELSGPQYRKINIGNFTENTKKIADSYILTQNNNVVKVLNIVESKKHNLIIIGKMFETNEPIFEQPIDSSHLRVKDIASELQYWPIEDVFKKIILFTLNDHNIAIPIIHSSV